MEHRAPTGSAGMNNPMANSSPLWTARACRTCPKFGNYSGLRSQKCWRLPAPSKWFDEPQFRTRSRSDIAGRPVPGLSFPRSRRIEVRVGILGGPGIPAALKAVNPSEFFAFERSIHRATGHGPAGIGFFVFERRCLRGNAVGVKMERTVFQASGPGDCGAGGLVPEDSYLISSNSISVTGAVGRLVEGKGFGLVGRFHAEHELHRFKPGIHLAHVLFSFGGKFCGQIRHRIFLAIKKVVSGRFG